MDGNQGGHDSTRRAETSRMGTLLRSLEPADLAVLEPSHRVMHLLSPPCSHRFSRLSESEARRARCCRRSLLRLAAAHTKQPASAEPLSAHWTGVSPPASLLRSLFPEEHATLSHALLLWAPVGCVVAPLRMLLWALCALADSPSTTDADGPLRFILRNLLGVSARWNNLELQPREGFHVLVSNHTSVGDFLLLYAQPRRVAHLIHPALPSLPVAKRHRVSFQHATPRALASLARMPKAERTLRPPVHLFPEGVLGSGAALLRFNRGFALLDAPVLPVAFRCRHALGIRTHTIDS